MAIYEYSCQSCGMGFEARRSMKDADAPIACPQCGTMKTKRGLSLFFASNSSKSADSSMSSSSSGCASCSSHSCASCGGH
jgi:putative FmdB family regulatory protein